MTNDTTAGVVVFAAVALAGAVLCVVVAWSTNFDDVASSAHGVKLMLGGLLAVVVGGEGMYVLSGRIK